MFFFSLFIFCFDLVMDSGCYNQDLLDLLVATVGGSFSSGFGHS